MTTSRKDCIELAVRIIKLTATLPKSRPGKHIADQLVRSGTSPAPNYGEARGAESSKDFVHKLKLVLKELNETEIWLDILQRSNISEDNLVREIKHECNELSRIIASSISTVTKRFVRGNN